MRYTVGNNGEKDLFVNFSKKDLFWFVDRFFLLFKSYIKTKTKNHKQKQNL